MQFGSSGTCLLSKTTVGLPVVVCMCLIIEWYCSALLCHSILLFLLVYVRLFLVFQFPKQSIVNILCHSPHYVWESLKITSRSEFLDYGTHISLDFPGGQVVFLNVITVSFSLPTGYQRICFRRSAFFSCLLCRLYILLVFRKHVSSCAKNSVLVSHDLQNGQDLSTFDTFLHPLHSVTELAPSNCAALPYLFSFIALITRKQDGPSPKFSVQKEHGQIKI
jgi:hypothetical protein